MVQAIRTLAISFSVTMPALLGRCYLIGCALPNQAGTAPTTAGDTGCNSVVPQPHPVTSIQRGQMPVDGPLTSTSMPASTDRRVCGPPLRKYRPQPHNTMGHVSASAAAPPRVRLPQGTYEGVVLAAGQNVIESAGLGLGIGSSGGGSSSSTSSSSSGPQPIPQQMALPKTLEAFLGIPYAQSTAGANRFRAPVPLAIDPRGAGGPIPATQLGQRCPGAAFNPFVPEGEDCLNLNVYRPASPSSSALASPLPVVIYVHSGGFNNGMGVERDMASFVAYAPVAVVAVSFNYRVGALGFLGLAGTGAVAPLNVGLRDQQALFAWVHRSIAAFGGDPDNVTLMGLSAGAHSVRRHFHSSALPPAPLPVTSLTLSRSATICCTTRPARPPSTRPSSNPAAPRRAPSGTPTTHGRQRSCASFSSAPACCRLRRLPGPPCRPTTTSSPACAPSPSPPCSPPVARSGAPTRPTSAGPSSPSSTAT